MIREERDPEFWRDVARSPEVAALLLFGNADVGAIALLAAVIPLAAEHGGFLLCPLDISETVFELHTMFKPESWGRPALAAAKDGMEFMRQRGAQVLVTYEVEGNWRSRPPKTFGWRRGGNFVPSKHLAKNIRTWSLSMNDWLASPACLRG